MLVTAVAFGLLLHEFFWGVGLALVLMPRRWRRFWPALALPAGMALQNLVVWCGAYADLEGTQAYAVPCEIIPVLMLVAGFLRNGTRPIEARPSEAPKGKAGQGGARPPGALVRVRAACLWSELTAWLPVAAVASGVLAALAYPLTQAAKGLTSASLGSCDAADYAAGARVLQSFAHHDRSGFLGLTEVVHVQSVDNFFDFWLRLNHFTPSALLAFNGTIFHCQPYELCSLLPMVILAGSVPVVFWTARAMFGLGRGSSLLVAALYGLNPLSWYAVYQVAIGQLIAAPAIALLTWGGVALWRSRLDSGTGRDFFGLLGLAYSLIWGAYNFMIVICLVPAVAYAGWQALGSRRLGRLLPWLRWMLIPLLISGGIFWARAAGLLERFELFQTYDFGWHISALTPEGWLGFVQGQGDLAPWPGGGRWIVAAGAVGLTALAGWRAVRRRRRSALVAAAVTLPILLGYYFLEARGARLGTNASYDAYKLFCVFYPVTLPAFAYWLTLADVGPTARLTVGALVLALAGGIGAADWQFWRAMSQPALIVDRDLIGVQRLETRPEVRSINLRLPLMWDRLWANALLLKRPQYFETHTYEGRLNTPLRGEWDLTGGLVSVQLPGEGSIPLNAHYTALRTDSRYYLHAELGAGWYAPERQPRSTLIWRWTGDDARVALFNPHPYPLKVALRVSATSLIPRQLQVWQDGRLLGSTPIGPVLGDGGARPPGALSPQSSSRSELGQTSSAPGGRAPPQSLGSPEGRASPTFPLLTVLPGRSEWSLRPDRPAARPSSGDDRRLAFSVFGVRLDVQPFEP